MPTDLRVSVSAPGGSRDCGTVSVTHGRNAELHTNRNAASTNMSIVGHPGLASFHPEERRSNEEVPNNT